MRHCNPQKIRDELMKAAGHDPFPQLDKIRQVIFSHPQWGTVLGEGKGRYYTLCNVLLQMSISLGVGHEDYEKVPRMCPPALLPDRSVFEEALKNAANEQGTKCCFDPAEVGRLFFLHRKKSKEELAAVMYVLDASRDKDDFWTILRYLYLVLPSGFLSSLRFFWKLNTRQVYQEFVDTF